MYPKVLVISNNAMNIKNSNGRTLGLLLSELPKDHLLQFCLNQESISEELVTNSYCISDEMIIKDIFRSSIKAEKLGNEALNTSLSCSRSRFLKKTPLTCIIREYFWYYSFKKLAFFDLAQEFKPDVVLLLLGDTSFSIQLANEISQKNKSRLIVYTTEDYYFKRWNYMDDGKHNKLFFVYMKHYRKTLKSAFRRIDLCIANTPALAKKYEKEFSVKTHWLMASASNFRNEKYEEKRNAILYAGNLSLNRYKSIIEVAHVAQMVDSSIQIEVYSMLTREMEQELKKETNIELKGFIPYTELLLEMQKVKLLVHCESFEEFYKNDLQSAFSTKIVDSLASGTPLLLFAPAHFAETKYLKVNQAAFVCTKSVDLEASLNEAIMDKDRRSTITRNALAIARENHNAKKNGQKMLQLLNEVLGGRNDG